MIKPGPNPSSEIASRVDSWLKEKYESYPNGIEEYQTNEAGFEIKLDHDFDSELFIEIVNKVEIPESKSLEAEELDDGSIAVQEVEAIGDGLLHRHSIGVTFGPDNVISLGGYEEPIMSSGEPSDTAVEDTLGLLLLYLRQHSR